MRLKRPFRLISRTLSHYLQEEVYARVDQIAISTNSLRDVDVVNCHALVQSFRNYIYDYARNRVTVYSFSTINQEGATYAIAADNVDGMKSSKDSYSAVILDGRHCCRPVEILRHEDGVDCVVQQLRERHTFRVHREPISPAQEK